MEQSPAREVVFAVEDEPSNLELLVRSLAPTLDVHPFSDPNEALKQAGELRPVLVVTDYRMPGLNGLELLRQLRDRGVPCTGVLVTGYSDLDEVERALAERLIERVVAKPFRPAELRTQAELAIGLYRLKERSREREP